MMEYSLPNDLIDKFNEVARANKISNEHIETLAYVAGYIEGNTIHGTHLVFPEQDGTSTKVDDKGNLALLP